MDGRATTLDMLNTSLAEMPKMDSPRHRDRQQRQLTPRDKMLQDLGLDGSTPVHAALTNIQAMQQQMSVFSADSREQDKDQSDADSHAYASPRSPRSPRKGYESDQAASRSMSPSPAPSPRRLPAELQQQPHGEMQHGQELPAPQQAHSPTLRGVKLRSGRLGSLRGSSLAPHHSRDSAKELADLTGKNKKLAELLVAARAANEGLQEKLSRSGRQAEAVKPLQARLKSLQEELSKARAEAEELREGLAAEKKKSKSQAQRIDILKEHQKQWHDKKAYNEDLNDRLRQALAMVNDQFQIAVQELSVTADQVEAIKGQAEGHKRAQAAAAASAAALAQQVAQLEALAGQLEARLPQEVARRQAAEEEAQRRQRASMDAVVPLAALQQQLQQAGGVQPEVVQQLLATVASQEQQLRGQEEELVEVKRHWLDLQRQASLGLEHQARASRMSQQVQQLMATVEAARGIAISREASASGALELAITSGRDSSTSAAPRHEAADACTQTALPLTVPAKPPSPVKSQGAIGAPKLHTAERAARHTAATQTSPTKAPSPVKKPSPGAHGHSTVTAGPLSPGAPPRSPNVSRPFSASAAPAAATTLVVSPLIRSPSAAAAAGALGSPSSPLLQPPPSWRVASPAGSIKAGGTPGKTPPAPDSMSRRASRRTVQIAEEIAALKAKLSSLRDDVSSNRIGSRASNWYRQEAQPQLQAGEGAAAVAAVAAAGAASPGAAAKAEGGAGRVLSFGDGVE